MYLEYWGMNRRPFAESHARDFFVPVESALLGLTKIRFAATSELSATCVAGPAGCGKSALVQLVLDEFSQAGWRTAYLANPNHGRLDLQQRIACRLGEPTEQELDDPVSFIATMLNDEHEKNGHVFLAIDDLHTVQNLSMLEDLRMLLNLQHDGDLPLSLILIGQESLQPMLEQASGFATHLGMQVRIGPMNPEEAKKYILYRLKVAGCSRGIFTRHAADLIAEYSRGVPRLINRLCELSLMTGYGLGEKKVGPEIVEMAADDLVIGLTEDPASPSDTPSLGKEAEATDPSPQNQEPEEIDVLAELVPLEPSAGESVPDSDDLMASL